MKPEEVLILGPNVGCNLVWLDERHGIRDSLFGLERAWKNISFQAPCHGQVHLPLEQIAQGPIQPGPEHLQGWGSPSLSAPVLHHLHREEFLVRLR